MKLETVLILQREDMVKHSKEKSIIDIDYTDMKYSSEPFVKNGFVLFIDDNGATKILKNRFGDRGEECFRKQIAINGKI